ncbi:Hypothetical_protein [Hexamita inflata]|uniref:Hypothetical_protein n=1 Tax=Hexamita inflata TaxID=28002 RepID=A0AA86QGR9_9EUKA|nr:Hypothetical protein HINF_LOCUS40612 [Hexamita inflata]
MINSYVKESASFAETSKWIYDQCINENINLLTSSLSEATINYCNELGNKLLKRCATTESYWNKIQESKIILDKLIKVCAKLDKFMTLKGNSNYTMKCFCQVLNQTLQPFKAKIADQIVIDQSDIIQLAEINKFFIEIERYENNVESFQQIVQSKIESKISDTLSLNRNQLSMTNLIQLTIESVLDLCKQCSLDGIAFIKLRDICITHAKNNIELIEQDFIHALQKYLSAEITLLKAFQSKPSIEQKRVPPHELFLRVPKFTIQLFQLIEHSPQTIIIKSEEVIKSAAQKTNTKTLLSFLLKYKHFCYQTLSFENKFFSLSKQFVNLRNSQELAVQSLDSEAIILLYDYIDIDFFMQLLVFYYCVHIDQRQALEETVNVIKLKIVCDIGEFLEEVIQNIKVDNFTANKSNLNRAYLNVKNIQKEEFQLYLGVVEATIDGCNVKIMPKYIDLLDFVVHEESLVFKTALCSQGEKEQLKKSLQNWYKQDKPEIFHILPIDEDEDESQSQQLSEFQAMSYEIKNLDDGIIQSVLMHIIKVNKTIPKGQLSYQAITHLRKYYIGEFSMRVLNQIEHLLSTEQIGCTDSKILCWL